jgi:hypothetical protein
MTRREQSQQLGCGCCPLPPHLCRTGQSLLAAARLAELFASENPGDALYPKLALLTRDALARHLMKGTDRTSQHGSRETPPSQLRGDQINPVEQLIRCEQ